MQYNLQEIRDELNEKVIDDILNDNCQVVISGGIENENYVFDIIARHTGNYDKTAVDKIFDNLEELLRLEEYFSKDILESFKRDPYKYASSIDKSNNINFLIKYDKNNAEVHVVCSKVDGTFEYILHSEVSEFNKTEKIIEIIFENNGEKLIYTVA